MSGERVHVFMVLVEHKPGVLQRVASLFSRRRYNIESITVGSTDKENIARMTIVTRGSDQILEQIAKQLNKLACVIKVVDLDKDASVFRELCLLKVHTPSEEVKTQVIQYANVFRGNIVDVASKSLTIEITGDLKKIDAFIELLKSFGIKEVARTGATGIQRG